MRRLLSYGVLFLLSLAVVGSAQNSRIYIKVEPYGDQANPYKVELGKTYQFTAKAYEATDPNLPPKEIPLQKVSWFVEPASFGTISPSGLLVVNNISPSGFKSYGTVIAEAALTGMRLRGMSVLLADGTPNNFDCSISGRVLDESGNAIADADVAAHPANSMITILFPTRTDKDGNYTIKLPAGKYLVTAQARGFVMEYYDGVFAPDKATIVEVDANTKSVTGIDFTLGTGGGISGKVYSKTDNASLKGAIINVWPATTSGSSNNWPRATAVTDANGDYTVSGLTPGLYIVQATMQGYVTLYYENVMDRQSAKAVDVKDNQTTTGIDFAMIKGGIDPNNPFTISGIVTDASNNPIAGATLFAEGTTTSNPGSRGFTGKTGQDGKYSITVPAGVYTVRASANGFMPEYFDDAKTRDKATKLTITQTNPKAENVNFVLTEGGKITGRVVKAIDGTPIEGALVYAAGDPSKLPSTGANTLAAITNANGEYTIPGLASGEYFVVAIKNGFEQQFYDRQSDPTLATKVDVTEGSTTTGINFELEMIAGISGKVIDQDNRAPIARAQIMISTGTSLRPFITYTDQNGDYRLELPAGTYPEISASAHMYATEWYDEKADPQSADPVTVTKGTLLTNIDFTLEHWSGVISGVVRDESGNPLDQIPVRAWAPTTTLTPNSYNRGNYGTALTGPDGSYEIRGVAPGKYTVSAGGKGYLVEFYDNVPDMSHATQVTVVNKQTTSGIDFSLTKGGNISGRVIDAKTNDPIPYAFVHVRGATAFADLGARTDDKGMYTIGGLNTGDYVIIAVAKGYRAEYYDNVVDPRNATPVSVTSPNTTTGIDFALDPVTISRTKLTGSVVDADTRLPAPFAIVESIDPVTNKATIATTDEQGIFEIEGNPNAVLRARAIGYVGSYAGGSTNWNDGKVPANGANLMFTLAPVSETGLAELTGTVTDAQTQAPVADAWIFGTDQEGNRYFSCSNLNGLFAIRGASDGTMEVTLSGVQYEQKQESTNLDGSTNSLIINANKSGTTVGAKEPVSVSVFDLKQNFPNPFNPSTTIAFSISKPGKVSLKVYTLLGQEVATLVNDIRSAGAHEVSWNAEKMVSGMYIYRLEANGNVATRKMTLLK